MKRINEKDVPFKYGKSGPKYLFNEDKFAGGIAYLSPGEEIKQHIHEDEMEIFYFIGGNPLFIVGDERIRVSAGDGFLVDIKEKHGILNDTQQMVNLVFIKIKKN